jgi:hypothetical protein
VIRATEEEKAIPDTIRLARLCKHAIKNKTSAGKLQTSANGRHSERKPIFEALMEAGKVLFAWANYQMPCLRWAGSIGGICKF